jgi:hypothetical protein
MRGEQPPSQGATRPADGTVYSAADVASKALVAAVRGGGRFAVRVQADKVLDFCGKTWENGVRGK